MQETCVQTAISRINQPHLQLPRGRRLHSQSIGEDECRAQPFGRLRQLFCPAACHATALLLSSPSCIAVAAEAVLIQG